jgi:solute carrier family 25 uncoupling protein 27
LHLLHRNVFHALYHIVTTEGVKGMYRGAHITTIRAGILAAGEFATYDNTKLFLRPFYGDTMVTHLMSGFAGAVVGTMVANPADVIKTRLMNQPRNEQGKGPLKETRICFFNRFLAKLPARWRSKKYNYCFEIKERRTKII